MIVLYSTVAHFDDFDPGYLGRVKRVLAHTQQMFQADATVLFSAVWTEAKPFRGQVVQVPMMPKYTYQIFVRKVLPFMLTGLFHDWTHAMSVHEDGFPIHPELWRDEFLNYDFIGAPWVDGVVGNDGFSIVSRRYCETLALDGWQPNHQACDDWANRGDMRAHLIRFGVKFAPTEIAQQFSSELVHTQSYGFHGRVANPEAYNYGWHLIEKEKL